MGEPPPSITLLSEELSTFADDYALLDTPQPTPKTTLELIGHRHFESAWHAFLAYFIDPTQPHGFDTAVLKAFITALETADAIDREQLDVRPAQVVVESEVSGDGNRPDLLLSEADRWFICIELKVHAGEGAEQTHRYATATTVGDYQKTDIPTDNHHYVYIAPETASESKHDLFIDVSWQTVVEHLQPLTTRGIGQYPFRSLAQLDDFITAIQDELNMTDIDTPTRQRTELYFEYQEQIEQVRAAVDDFVDRVLKHEWATAIRDTYQPTFWDGSWEVAAVGKKYGKLRRTDWRQSDGLDIHFEHFPKKENFIEGKLKFDLHLEYKTDTGDRDRLREPIHERFCEQVPTKELPQETTVGCGELERFHPLLRIEYTFTPGDEQDYYATLQSALEDHAAVIPLVDKLVEAYPFETTDDGES